MTRDDTSNKEFDILVANSLYPDATSVFTWRPQPIEEVTDDCVIVLDTNVLVVPYTISPKSLAVIGRTYRTLISGGRLLVPGQVAREFAKQRANKLAELQQQLANKKSQAVKLQTGRYPLLEGEAEYQQALQIEEQANRLLNEYQEAIAKVMDRVRRWTWRDPVSLLYGALIDEAVVVDLDIDRAAIEKDLDWRRRHKIPPGYKDASKDDQGIGDLLIWHTILKIGEDRKTNLVFVTGDEKADWWHRSGSGALYPRHELVEEFRRRSEGHSFHVIHFSSLLDLYGAGNEVVEEVRRKETDRSQHPYYSGNAINVPDGRILVVRHSGKYGALKPLEQTSMERGASIRYQWWYQPDGSSSFTNSSVQTGYGEAREGASSGPRLLIGPIELEWSVCGDRLGWVYFGPLGGHSPDYELALTSETDISKLDLSRLQFLRQQGHND